MPPSGVLGKADSKRSAHRALAKERDGSRGSWNPPSPTVVPPSGVLGKTDSKRSVHHARPGAEGSWGRRNPIGPPAAPHGVTGQLESVSNSRAPQPPFTRARWSRGGRAHGTASHLLSINGSGTAQLFATLDSLRWGKYSRVSVVMVQELQRDKGGVSDLSYTLQRMGWQFAGAPSVVTTEGGLSAGSGLLV